MTPASKTQFLWGLRTEKHHFLPLRGGESWHARRVFLFLFCKELQCRGGGRHRRWKSWRSSCYSSGVGFRELVVVVTGVGREPHLPTEDITHNP